MAEDIERFAVGEAARGEAEEGAVGARVAVGEEGDEAAGGGDGEGAEMSTIKA